MELSNLFTTPKSTLWNPLWNRYYYIKNPHPCERGREVFAKRLRTDILQFIKYMDFEFCCIFQSGSFVEEMLRAIFNIFGSQVYICSCFAARIGI